MVAEKKILRRGRKSNGVWRKRYLLGKVSFDICDAKFRGMVLKRSPDFAECTRILDSILGVKPYSRKEFKTFKDYRKYQETIITDMTDWLTGAKEDRPMGFLTAMQILAYLKERKIV